MFIELPDDVWINKNMVSEFYHIHYKVVSVDKFGHEFNSFQKTIGNTTSYFKKPVDCNQLLVIIMNNRSVYTVSDIQAPSDEMVLENLLE